MLCTSLSLHKLSRPRSRTTRLFPTFPCVMHMDAEVEKWTSLRCQLSCCCTVYKPHFVHLEGSPVKRNILISPELSHLYCFTLCPEHSGGSGHHRRWPRSNIWPIFGAFQGVTLRLAKEGKRRREEKEKGISQHPKVGVSHGFISISLSLWNMVMHYEHVKEEKHCFERFFLSKKNGSSISLRSSPRNLTINGNCSESDSGVSPSPKQLFNL